MKRIKNSFIFRIVLIGIIIFIISTFFIQVTFVVGDSMSPNYNNKDILLMNKCNPHITYNDVIVIRSDNVKQTIIKRVIALPGDTIQIVDGIVYVNNKVFTEDSDVPPMNDSGMAREPITLGNDEYFVLGDNRNASIDSRFEPIGLIPASSIIGKVLFHF
jgi:signal peptidase I